MTHSSNGFISYRPCQSNKIIAFGDGTFITMARKGDIMINHNLILKDVLHVSKLLANLIFVHKLTMDLLCLGFLILQPTNFRIKE